VGITPDRGGPVTDRIASDVRRRIAAGELKPGERLGTATDMARHYDAGLTTVRAALLRLGEEGLILAGKGRAYRVREEHVKLELDLGYESRSRHKGTAGDQWDDMVAGQGHKPSQDIEMLVRSAAQVPPDVARLLRTGGKIVVRSRRRQVDGHPGMLSVSYFPYDIVKDTPLMEPEDVHVPGGVLAACGHPQAWQDWTIAARMPTEDEADWFDLARGVPVFEITCTGYEVNDEHPEGLPVRVMVSTAPADRWTVSARMDAA
jgi:GntR family transcriptional regulator